jgi:hypothetical protein
VFLMARYRLASFGAALAIGLSPGGARAEFDATSDAHRLMQTEAQARKDRRAAEDGARTTQAVDSFYEPTLGEWLDARGAGRNGMIQWMGGVYSGLLWSNAELAARGQAPVFCPSSQAQVTGQGVAALVAARQGAGAPLSRNQPLGAVVVSAVKSAFPCRAAP